MGTGTLTLDARARHWTVGSRSPLVGPGGCRYRSAGSEMLLDTFGRERRDRVAAVVEEEQLAHGVQVGDELHRTSGIETRQDVSEDEVRRFAHAGFDTRLSRARERRTDPRRA